MSQVLDGLVTIVAGLKPSEQKGLVDRLISSGVLCQSAEDALLITSRRNEPTADYRQFRKRHLARGKKR